MPGPRIAVAVLLLALLAGTWYWLSSRELPPLAAPAAVVTAPATVPPVETPAAPARTEVSASPAAPGLVVLVQDRERRPIAGASIAVRGDDPELSFPLTDSDGRARAARLPYADVYLTAKHGGMTGSVSWRWDASMRSEVTIWMQPDRLVEVSVATATGAPQPDVEVGLIGGKETDWRNPSHKARTDAGGVAHFEVAGDHWLAAGPSVRAVAGAIASEAVAWNQEGPTMIAIVAVETAAGPRLRVHFVDDQGAPAAVHGKLSWSRIHSAGGGTVIWPVGDVQVDGSEGAAQPLQDGDQLMLTLAEEGRIDATQRVELTAGVREQEVTMRRGKPAPRLAIPLVDGDGRPVTTGEFVVTVLLDRAGYEYESKLTPDARGVLTVTLSNAAAGSVEVAERRDPARLHWPARERPKRPYRTTMGHDAPPNPPLAVQQFALVQAGEVRTVQPVTVAEVAPRITGVVVDTNGQPAAGALVWMTTVTAPEPEPFAAFATKADAAGRFSILATSLPEEVFVCARRPLGFGAPVRVRPPAEGVVLRLQPTGAIALDLRPPARTGLPDAALATLRPAVYLRSFEGSQADGQWAFHRLLSSLLGDEWRVRAPIPEHGETVFMDLVPGLYHVVGNIGPNRVLDLAPVRVDAAATARPLAQPLSFGSGVEASVVRVRDEQGRPLAKAWVEVDMATWQPRSLRVATDDAGEAWFAVPRGVAAQIDVEAPGHAPVHRQDAGLPLEIDLGVGTSLDIAIGGAAAAARDSRSLVVVCRPHAGAPPDSPVQTVAKLTTFRYPNAQLDAAGRATIPNLPPGTYRLWLGAMPPLQSRRGLTFVLLGDRTVTAGDPAHVNVDHELTAEATAVLLGRG